MGWMTDSTWLLLISTDCFLGLIEIILSLSNGFDCGWFIAQDAYDYLKNKKIWIWLP